MKHLYSKDEVIKTLSKKVKNFSWYENIPCVILQDAVCGVPCKKDDFKVLPSYKKAWLITPVKQGFYTVKVANATTVKKFLVG